MYFNIFLLKLLSVLILINPKKEGFIVAFPVAFPENETFLEYEEFMNYRKYRNL